MIHPILAAAAVDDTLKAYTASGDGLSVLVYLKVIFLLIVIIAFIIFALWAARKFAPQRIPASRTGIIKILGYSYLGPKKALYLIEAAGKVILIGVTDNNINKVADFAEGEETENMKRHLEQSPPPAGFSQIFASMFQKRNPQ